ncbi:MAG: hypothetical protein AAGI66_01975 [Cyanobacteria bacterium P01_H01_bin.74]
MVIPIQTPAHLVPGPNSSIPHGFTPRPSQHGPVLPDSFTHLGGQKKHNGFLSKLSNWVGRLGLMALAGSIAVKLTGAGGKYARIAKMVGYTGAGITAMRGVYSAVKGNLYKGLFRIAGAAGGATIMYKMASSKNSSQTDQVKPTSGESKPTATTIPKSSMEAASSTSVSPTASEIAAFNEAFTSLQQDSEKFDAEKQTNEIKNQYADFKQTGNYEGYVEVLHDKNAFKTQDAYQALMVKAGKASLEHKMTAAKASINALNEDDIKTDIQDDDGKVMDLAGVKAHLNTMLEKDQKDTSAESIAKKMNYLESFGEKAIQDETKRQDIRQTAISAFEQQCNTSNHSGNFESYEKLDYQGLKGRYEFKTKNK